MLAPNDAAFEKLLTALNTNVTELLADEELLQNVLRCVPLATLLHCRVPGSVLGVFAVCKLARSTTQSCLGVCPGGL